jgi:hypothetical protein
MWLIHFDMLRDAHRHVSFGCAGNAAGTAEFSQ